jgi:hypothetical protein
MLCEPPSPSLSEVTVPTHWWSTTHPISRTRFLAKQGGWAQQALRQEEYAVLQVSSTKSSAEAGVDKDGKSIEEKEKECGAPCIAAAERRTKIPGVSSRYMSAVCHRQLEKRRNTVRANGRVLRVAS